MAEFERSCEFTWGKPIPTSNKQKKYYTSFFYDNEEYSLYDNVSVYDEKQSNGHVAKIMKLWEDIASGTMMTLLRWYLKPLELPSHLQTQVLCENSRELFLAFGKGRGVSNENKLDCIERKCKVLCTSKNVRNKQPSEEDLKAADYIYNRIYNVDLKKLSNLDGIVKILPPHVLFNKPEWVSSDHVGHQDSRSLPVDTFPSTTTNTTVAASQQPAEVGKPGSDSTTRESKGNQGQSILLKRGSKVNNLNLPLKKTSLVSDEDKPVESRTRLQTSIKKEAAHLSSSVSKASQDNVERSPSTVVQPLTRSASAKRNEQSVLKAKIEANNASETSSTGRALFADPLQAGFLIPTRARSKQVQHHDTIVPPKPQHANLAENLSHQRVLLIQNIDRSINHKDMNDLMKSTLEGCSDVQMLQRSGSLCAPAGEALLVFETEDLADAALEQFEENCLIVSGCSRPLTACKIGLPDVEKIVRFPGHFPLDNFKLWKQRQEEVMRKSFESFHFSDPKSVEFEMASEWKNLHEWLASCWKQLCKVQDEETKLLFEKYKKPRLTLP